MVVATYGGCDQDLGQYYKLSHGGENGGYVATSWRWFSQLCRCCDIRRSSRCSHSDNTTAVSLFPCELCIGIHRLHLFLDIRGQMYRCSPFHEIIIMRNGDKEKIMLHILVTIPLNTVILRRWHIGLLIGLYCVHINPPIAARRAPWAVSRRHHHTFSNIKTIKLGQIRQHEIPDLII